MIDESRHLGIADGRVANTTIAAGDTTEEIYKLGRRDDGNFVVWAGVGLWRPLMQDDLEIPLAAQHTQRSDIYFHD